MINNPEASFEGIVISDKDNANVETTPNTARNATDYTVNAKTAYVQMLDGSYGYRLQFDAADDNTLKRYSQVKISLNGVTLTKEADPERYTLSGLTAANIVSQTPGTASDLIRKEKSIGPAHRRGHLHLRLAPGGGIRPARRQLHQRQRRLFRNGQPHQLRTPNAL